MMLKLLAILCLVTTITAQEVSEDDEKIANRLKATRDEPALRDVLTKNNLTSRYFWRATVHKTKRTISYFENVNTESAYFQMA